MVNHSEWFKDCTIEYMDKQERLDLIKANFLKLKEAYNWCQSHQEMNKDQLYFFEFKLMPAVEKIYTELEGLGVDKTFSAALFIMGGLVTEELVRQFEK